MMLELSLRLFVRRHLMTKKQKHLTLEDRIDIQTGISQQETFRSIAEKIGEDWKRPVNDFKGNQAQSHHASNIRQI